VRVIKDLKKKANSLSRCAAQASAQGWEGGPRPETSPRLLLLRRRRPYPYSQACADVLDLEAALPSPCFR